METFVTSTTKHFNNFLQKINLLLKLTPNYIKTDQVLTFKSLNFLPFSYIFQAYEFSLFVFLQEILNYNCRELVNVVPFFQGADPLFVSGVVAKLKHEVYQPGDYVIMEGTIGTKMFFIQQGTVDVVTNNGTCVAQLFDGSYFGGELKSRKKTDIIVVLWRNIFHKSQFFLQILLDSSAWSSKLAVKKITFHRLLYVLPYL